MTLRWRLGGLERVQAQVWWGRGGRLNCLVLVDHDYKHFAGIVTFLKLASPVCPTARNLRSPEYHLLVATTLFRTILLRTGARDHD